MHFLSLVGLLEGCATVYLVVVEGGEDVVEQLLVVDRRDAARHGRDQPHPICRAAPAQTELVLKVLHERL